MGLDSDSIFKLKYEYKFGYSRYEYKTDSSDTDSHFDIYSEDTPPFQVVCHFAKSIYIVFIYAPKYRLCLDIL